MVRLTIWKAERRHPPPCTVGQEEATHAKNNTHHKYICSAVPSLDENCAQVLAAWGHCLGSLAHAEQVLGSAATPLLRLAGQNGLPRHLLASGGMNRTRSTVNIAKHVVFFFLAGVIVCTVLVQPARTSSRAGVRSCPINIEQGRQDAARAGQHMHSIWRSVCAYYWGHVPSKKAKQQPVEPTALPAMGTVSNVRFVFEQCGLLAGADQDALVLNL